MNEQLIIELERTKDELLKIIAPLSDKQFSRTFSSNEWTVIQVIEHLCLIEEAYMREFFLCLHLPAKLITTELKFDKYQFPEKMKAKEAYEPLGRFSSKQIAIKTFLHDRQLLIDQIKNCNIDLKAKMTYRNQKPFQTLYDMIITNCEHTTRHTKQIENILTRKKNGT